MRILKLSALAVTLFLIALLGCQAITHSPGWGLVLGLTGLALTVLVLMAAWGMIVLAKKWEKVESLLLSLVFG